MLWYLLIVVFVLGACIGSFLNVCIYRMPLEKSILWPASRCGSCFQAISWYDNIPLLSYWLLRGKCRSCGAAFSMRYFFIELFTGLCFSGLFYVEVIENIHGFGALARERALIEQGNWPSMTAWIVFGYHAILMSMLIVASFCDFDHREIPLTLTVPGTAFGLIGAMLLPWPWPWQPADAVIPPGVQWWGLNLQIKSGVYPWPVWGPLPDWLPPGSWQLGLITGLVGAAVGTIMLRIIRLLFGLGMGVEALGLGDADLMMMAGAFLGWQPIVVAFFIGVFAGLFFGVAQMVLSGDNALPFGPGLSIGVLTAMICWEKISPGLQVLFFNDVLILFLVGASCALMLALSYVLRLLKLMRR